MRNEFILIIIGMTAVTFFTRFGCIALFGSTGMPAWLDRWLKHIPTAILTSLTVPGLFLPTGAIDISWNNHYLIAGTLTAVIAFKTRSMPVTLVIGLGTMLALKWFAANY